MRMLLRHRPVRWLLMAVLPQLGARPVRDWPVLLDRVGRTGFDTIERIGLVFAVVLTTWLLRPPAEPAAHAAIVFLTQLLLALPLLLLLAGPFFLRRMRRGLDEAARLGTLPDGEPERSRHDPN